MRLADHCFVEAGFILINYEVSGCPLLAAEDLALKHGHSMPPDLWYQAETGLDNSTLLAPIDGETSDLHC
jgi:hypothetical protein